MGAMRGSGADPASGGGAGARVVARRGAADPRECGARRRRRRGLGLIFTLAAIVGLLAATGHPSAARPGAAAAPALAWKPCRRPRSAWLSVRHASCRWTTTTRAGARSGSP